MLNSNGFSDFINAETLTLYANTNEELLTPGTWSWGNKGASRMADAVALALSRKYGSLFF